MAVKKTVTRYQEFSDSVIGAIRESLIALDQALRVTTASRSVKILWGYEPIEVVKQHAFETLTPSAIDLSVRVLAEIMELEKSEHRDINISRTLQLETIRSRHG